jgi:hypothetical protein
MRIPLLSGGWPGGLLAWALLGGLPARPAAAQDLAAADSSLVAATRSMQARYRAAMGGQLGLYSGLQYGNLTSPLILGHPYFGPGTEPWTGGVDYDGQHYAGLTLWYDLLRDAVVTVRYDSPAQLRLVSPRVTAFTLGPHRFVRVPELLPGTRQPGFYELLFAGHDSLQVLARYSKLLTIVPNDRQGRREYQERDQLYLRRGGQYYAVGKPGSVLRALGSHQKELRRFVAERRLRFDEEHRPASVVLLVAEYDRLTTSAR